jgi:tetratricopeptide (TPR) repeat protein
MTSDLYKKGDVIAGKYVVHQLLGKGGFGVVYLVHLRETGEAFALKTFKDELTANPAACEAFKKEALVWVNLERHPFILSAIWVEEVHHGRIATSNESGKLILPARSVQEVSGRLFVVMDYVAADAKGRANLWDHLAGDPLDESQMLKWGIQFCLGMEHAKAHGVECHRDIKPANIMITQDGTLKVSDFGLAIATEAAWRGGGGRVGSLLPVSKDGDVGFSVMQADGKVRCGTPGYIAPEVYRFEGANIRSDIYSFGLVLWQMAAGSRVPPFSVPLRGDMESYMRGIYEQQIAGRVPRVEGPLGSVIERCLRPTPLERYRTFQELRDALEPMLERRTGQKFEITDVGEKTASFWNNKGGSLAALGRHEEAIRCYDTALAINSNVTQIWNNKGSALSALGRGEEAIQCYDKALAIDPQFVMALCNKGSALHILGQHEEAIRFYDKVLSIDSRDVEAWLSKGSVLTTRGQHENALVCYDRAMAIDPKNAKAAYNKGLSLLSLGKDNEAISCFDQTLRVEPRFEMAWVNKGNALAAQERYDEAIACFDHAIAINPKNAGALNTKGTSLAALGRCEEAIVCCEQALSVDPGYATAWVGKGAVLFSIGKHEEAGICYDKALALNPRTALTWLSKGFVLATLERYRDALVCFQEAQKLGEPTAAQYVAQYQRFLRTDEVHLGAAAANTNGAQEWFSKAANLAKLGKHAEAVSCYETGLRLDPKNAAAWFNMGHSIGFLGRHQDVVKCCDRALEIHPNVPPLWILKGLGLLSMERFQDAMACFQQAKQLGDANAAGHMARCRMAQAEWYFRLGSDYQQEGNNAEVIRCYEKGLAIDPTNAIIWCNKGAALLALKRGQEAVVCFDRAIALDPRDASAWNNKGCALLAIGQQSEGYACLQEAKRLRT